MGDILLGMAGRASAHYGILMKVNDLGVGVGLRLSYHELAGNRLWTNY
jgi:hypothetical protein